MTYQEAERLFATARDKSKGKKLKNNTYLVKNGNSFAVRLYWTNVVTIYPEGIYQLNTGGWRKNTTKDRINNYSPVYIFQEKGDWFIEKGVHFFDGMCVDATGSHVHYG